MSTFKPMLSRNKKSHEKKKVLKIRSVIRTETLQTQKTLQSSNISSVPLIPFEDDACWSLNIADFLLLWRRSSCFLFFSFRLPAHPPQRGGCRLWLPRQRRQRLPGPAERSAWWTERELKVTKLKKIRDDMMMRQNNVLEASVSLHLVALGRFHRSVLVFLDGVSDEPHSQEDQDEAEQRADHSASNHSIWHICTKQDIFTSIKGAFYMCLGLFFFIITIINK